jgi:PIN domain nuclease of toxin-antitoxin system
MKLLIDTNTLLWAAGGDIDPQSAALIDDEANTVFYSTVSIWEIVIKKALDKENFDIDVDELIEFLNASGYRRLDITEEQILTVGALPLLHKDPFDRLLIAQARYERMTLLAGDQTVCEYGISTRRTRHKPQTSVSTV